jgi:ribose 5-phosphate isomerase A
MVLGLGTGSTTRYALEDIGSRLKTGKLQDILGIPSSLQTEKIAGELGIPLTNFDEHQEIDLTIDGADEVDPELNLIKGGGGALLREKILAQSSRRNVIIVDEYKLSPKLGTHFALPVEVIPFAWKPEANYISSLGGKISLRKNNEGSVYTTDQNNFILDCKFGPISDLKDLALKLSQRAGIVEHGLFLGLATEVIVATENEIRHLKRRNT